MAVCGYLYLKSIHIYKSNLEQYLQLLASSTSENLDNMATLRFALMAGPLLPLQASTPSVLNGEIFLSITSLYNRLSLEE